MKLDRETIKKIKKHIKENNPEEVNEIIFDIMPKLVEKLTALSFPKGQPILAALCLTFFASFKDQEKVRKDFCDRLLESEFIKRK